MACQKSKKVAKTVAWPTENTHPVCQKSKKVAKTVANPTFYVSLPVKKSKKVKKKWSKTAFELDLSEISEFFEKKVYFPIKNRYLRAEYFSLLFQNKFGLNKKQSSEGKVCRSAFCELKKYLHLRPQL